MMINNEKLLGVPLKVRYRVFSQRENQQQHIFEKKKSVFPPNFKCESFLKETR